MVRVSFSVRGHVMDILGYPIEGVGVRLGTGYSLEDGFQKVSDRVLAGPVTTDSGGAFALFDSEQDQDVGLQVFMRGFGTGPVNVRQVTGTSIPFSAIELWSPEFRWVNDLLPLGTFNDLNVYWDGSRRYLFGAVPNSWPDLLTASDILTSDFMLPDSAQQ